MGQGCAAGHTTGHTARRATGQQTINMLLYKAGRTEDLIRSIQDTQYQKQLLEEYGLLKVPEDK